MEKKFWENIRNLFRVGFFRKNYFAETFWGLRLENALGGCILYELRASKILNIASQQNIYLFKVINKNTSRSCEICSKLTIMTPKQSHWCRSGVCIVNFEHISHFFLVFLLWTLNIYLHIGLPGNAMLKERNESTRNTRMNSINVSSVFITNFKHIQSSVQHSILQILHVQHRFFY